MVIPKIDIKKIDNFGVLTGIQAAINILGNDAVAVFLDLVPERGGQLWLRFRKFQESQENLGFHDFILKTLEKERTKIFFPQGCILDTMTRSFLIGEITAMLKAQASITDFPLIYFMVPSPALKAARNICCKGCHMNCPNRIKHHTKD